MSNSSDALSIFPSGLSLTGGIPLHNQDFAPSIGFAIAYLVLFPLGTWRLLASSSRCVALIRPWIFILARIGTYIVRARISQGHYEKNLFIAEQILLLCGFVLLCEPLVTILGFHIIRNYIPTGSSQPILMRVQALLKLALFVALILGVYAGSKIGDVSSDGNDASTIKTIKSCRDANVIISLTIVVLAAFVSVGAYMTESPKIPFLPTMHIVAISIFLATASFFKMIFYYSHASPVSKGTKIAFYSLSALPEFCACFLLFAINLPVNYSIAEAKQKQKDDKAMKNGTYTGPGYSATGRNSQEALFGTYPPPPSYPPNSFFGGNQANYKV